MNRLSLLNVGLSVVVIGCLVFLIARPAPAEPAADQSHHTITAIGLATVVGKPDSARVYFGVVTNGKTVAGARAENARIVGEVQEALRELKLATLRARTSESHVSINYA